MMARTSVSSSHIWKASAIAMSISRPKALRFSGRFIVRVTTCPSRSIVSWSEVNTVLS
jgi:hypothetical protein